MTQNHRSYDRLIRVVDGGGERDGRGGEGGEREKEKEIKSERVTEMKI
jgi:hypothetical protein